MDRKAKQRRLERAGYVYIGGWVPADSWSAVEMRDQVIVHEADVDRIASEPPKPRGRPKKA